VRAMRNVRLCRQWGRRGGARGQALCGMGGDRILGLPSDQRVGGSNPSGRALLHLVVIGPSSPACCVLRAAHHCTQREGGRIKLDPTLPTTQQLHTSTCSRPVRIRPTSVRRWCRASGRSSCARRSPSPVRVLADQGNTPNYLLLYGK
jgi:hypothetical protein